MTTIDERRAELYDELFDVQERIAELVDGERINVLLGEIVPDFRARIPFLVLRVGQPCDLRLCRTVLFEKARARKSPAPSGGGVAFARV